MKCRASSGAVASPFSNDLSPAAAFIAHNYNVRVDPLAFFEDAESS